MKGDAIRAIVDVGGGTREFVTAATKAGRRVEVVKRGTMVEVAEVTRTGQPIKTNTFMASRVVALIDERQEEEERNEQGA